MKKNTRFSLALLLLLPALFFSTSLSAAPCTDIFDDPSGENGELETEGATLDLSAVPWSDNPWPASGSELSAGRYFFDELGDPEGYVLDIEEGAEVIIFVDGDFEIEEGSRINQNGDPSQLTIIARDDIGFDNNSNSPNKRITFNGLLYAGGNIEIGNNNEINGILGAEDEIDNKSGLNRDDSAINFELLDGLCEPPSMPLPVFDSFESYPLGSVDGLDGGTGWGGPWEGRAGQSVVDNSGNPLIFDDGTGRTIRSQRSLEIDGNDDRVAVRPLDGTFTGDQIYMSMLVRFEGTPGDNDFLGFWVQAPGFGDSPQFGIKTNEGGGGSRDFFVRLDTDASYDTEFSSGETYFLVAEFNKNNADFFNEGRIWVNPACGDTPPATASAETTNPPSNQVEEISEIGFRGANLGGDERVQVGQVAAGENWQDVVNCSRGPLVFYRMESEAWSGAPGEVLDTTVNDRHATPDGGVSTELENAEPAITGDPGTCRYGVFDGNDDGLRDGDAGDYLNGLESITVMGWVYNSADLAGNDRGIFFTADTSSGRDNRLGLRYDTDGFFGGGNNVIKASVLTDDCDPNQECVQVETDSDVMVQDQWQHVAMTWTRGGLIRVFVDGSEVGISETQVAGGDGAISGVDRLDVGQGAKGQRWQGRIDEFRIFGAALSEAEIQQQKDLTFPCEGVGPHHIRLDHPGEGLTCSPSNVDVTACADAGCTTEFSEPVDVEFTSPAGNWSPNPVTLNGSETVQLQYTTDGTVTLDARANDPEAQNETRCFDGSGETCDMEFFESGFLVDVPDHVSDTEVAGTITAVKESDSSDRCVPGFSNESKDVELWSDYVNPSSGSESVFIDGSGIPSGSPGEVRTLNFDDNGVAALDLRYPDSGRVALTAFYEQTDSNALDSGLRMQGSGRFVARPDHFELTVPGNPAATTVQPGNDFVAAGADFDVEVRAVNASGATTPNFGQESPAESVELASSLFAPSTGSPGSLSGDFDDFGQDCNSNSAGGVACGVFQWSEVGIISLVPSLQSGAYLGTVDIEGNELSNVGRFIPDRFETEMIDQGSVDPFCGVSGTEFAYSGQVLSWQDRPRFRVTALNTGGDVTENYTISDFRRLELGGIDRDVPMSDLSALDRNGNPYPVDVQQDPLNLVDASSGVMTYRYADSDEITHEKSNDTRVDPFPPELEFTIVSALDADGVSSPDLPLNFVPDSSFSLRFGRLRLDNTFGPETRNLIMPMQIEYWDSGRFVVNMDEGCWNYDAGADTTLNPSDFSAASGSGTMMAGKPPSGSELVLAAPGEGNTGEVDVTFGVPRWLKDDFNGDGVLTAPTATATFGVFRGHDRIIYWRERTE